jgi:hypothetical protein
LAKNPLSGHIGTATSGRSHILFTSQRWLAFTDVVQFFAIDVAGQF